MLNETRGKQLLAAAVAAAVLAGAGPAEAGSTLASGKPVPSLSEQASAATDIAADVARKIKAKVVSVGQSAGNALKKSVNGDASPEPGKDIMGKAKGSEARETDAARGRRDPFSTTQKLVKKNEAAARERQFDDNGMGFTPAAAPVKIMPKMTLKGHLQGAGGEVVALLEIEGGGVHVVREGDTVGLHDIGVDTVLRIKTINRLHMVVESGSLNKLIIVR